MSDFMPMDLASVKGAAALEIVRKLKTAGYDALFAGGCVRDHLLGIQPTDYDIATSATPDQVESLFPKTIPVGKQFGVILVIVEGMQFEVATFRTEGGYQDGRRPGFINFSNAKEDALRRDFTVNGMFYDPIKQEPLDYVGGQEDLKHKVIRCIGDPVKRFEEDKLRLLRAVRFAVRLGFKIEALTKQEIRKRASQITAVSQERIRDEVDKILTSNHVKEGLDLLVELGLWEALWPKIDHEAVLLRFAGLGSEGNLDSALANAILLYGRDPAVIAGEMHRFRYSSALAQATLHILGLVTKLQGFDSLSQGEKRLAAADEHFLSALRLYSKALNETQHVRSIQDQIAPWAGKSLPKQLLNGDDLKKVGIMPGPKMGEVLYQVFLRQLEDKFKDKDQALSWAKAQI